MEDFLATSIPGAEDVLCEELRDLGFAGVRLNRGGIPFRGERQEGWRACLQSRIAQRIQLLLGRFPAASAEALYAGVRAVGWERFLTAQQTLSVAAISRGSALQHSGFVALKAKDAIVDRLRDQTGTRPSISREDADVRVVVYVAGDKASLYLDLSGESLHRRGYRREAGTAPMKETLAAVLLRLSGWDRQKPLVDPMCGSGTIAIEAALWAANIAPGLARGRFGFERWADFTETDAAALKELCGCLRAEIKHERPRIIAADADEGVLEKAKANAKAAGVRLTFRHQSVLDLQGGGAAGVVLCNPPYGVRLEQQPDLARGMASAFCRLHGWRICLLAGAPDYEKTMPLRPVKKLSLPNGDLPCDFLTYDIP